MDIAWTSALQNAGFAAGAALVGPIIDRDGPHVAAFVPLLAGVLAAGISVATGRRASS